MKTSEKIIKLIEEYSVPKSAIYRELCINHVTFDRKLKDNSFNRLQINAFEVKWGALFQNCNK